MTLAEFRELVREEAGDPERISGTASSGTTTTIVSSSLSQADNIWKRLNAYIKTTGDSAAPQGESKRIASSSSSATLITLESPYSAAVENGDTFGIAVFSESRVDGIITRSLHEFSRIRPRKFTENLSVTAGNKRFTPTSASDPGFRPQHLEFFSNASREQTPYKKDEFWHWNKHLNQVEFTFWWDQAKTLTLYGVKDYVIPGSDGDEMELDNEYEYDVAQIAAINLLISMSNREFTNDSGNLAPKSITRGQVKHDFGDSKEKMVASLTEIKKEILRKYRQPFTINLSRAKRGLSIDKQEDPDGTPMPQVFWKLT